MSTDPRIVRSRQAILAGALGELSERGYGGFTIDAVAGRAGVARSTIYRLWGNKARLVADAIDELNQQPAPRPPAAETPRQRIQALIHHLVDAMEGSPVSDCLPALIDGAERDESIRQVHHAYNERRRAALVGAIRDALDVGDVRPDVDPDLAGMALAGAVIYCRLMTPTPLPATATDQLIDTVLGPARLPGPERPVLRALPPPR